LIIVKLLRIRFDGSSILESRFWIVRFEYSYARFLFYGQFVFESKSSRVERKEIVSLKRRWKHR